LLSLNKPLAVIDLETTGLNIATAVEVEFERLAPDAIRNDECELQQ